MKNSKVITPQYAAFSSQQAKNDFTINVKPSTRFSRQHITALYYASMGFQVLPIWPNSKKPLTPNGHADATTDPTQITRWWKQKPNANVAIVTNDMLVVDVDVKNGKDGRKVMKAIEGKYGPLPKTLMQITPSGGMHFIYRTNGVIVPSLIDCPAPGVDIRAHNGYILVAPSSIDGKPYVMNMFEIADAPSWLINLVMEFVSDDKMGYHSGYHDTKESTTSLKLKSEGEIVCITGMGQTLKVKYDPVANKLVTL